MRELDVLLSNYLDTTYATSGDTDKRAFRKLLALSDPDLHAYLLGAVRPEDLETAHVVDLIRGSTTP